MATLDPATLAPKIAQAKAAGYSDDEIVGFLSEQAPDQFKAAKDAGYNASEIIGHFAPPTSDGRDVRVRPVGSQPSEGYAPEQDHGKERRRKMSLVEQAVSPITEWPRHYDEMRRESADQLGTGLGQLYKSFSEAKGDLSQPGELGRLWEATKGVGNVGLGALGYTMSPISAAYRSVVGQPIEDATGIPRELPEFAAQMVTPGIGIPKMPTPGSVPIVPRGYRTGPEPVLKSTGTEAGDAARRIDVDVPLAVTTDSRTVQGVGAGLSKTPLVGEPVAQAVEDVAPQLARVRDRVADEIGGGGTAPNSAMRIDQQLTKAAEDETRAAREAADAQHQTELADWTRTNQQREAALANQEQQSAAAAQQRVGPDVVPLNMGEHVIDTVRTNERSARAAKDAAYADAGRIEATVLDGAIGDAHQIVRGELGRDRGRGRVVLDREATPVARSMMQRIRQFSEISRQRAAAAIDEAVAGGGTAADAAPTGRSMADLEGLRQDLNFIAQGTKNDADQRAARRIIRGFDDWHEGAVQGSLMEGSDPGALAAIQQARAANRDWRQRFGYNNRDDADKLINKIVRGEDDQFTGPNAVSDALMKGGDRAGPLYQRVMEATGNSQDVLQGIRSATWNKLSRDAEGAAARTPQRIRSDIYQYLHGKGRDVAQRVFTDEQRALMQAHADTVRDVAAGRVAAAADAAAATPRPIRNIEPGPMQRLADDVIGGGKANEDLFRLIEGDAKSKKPDIRRLAEVMRNIPQSMKEDFVHNFIKNLGVSPKTKEFSAAVFAKEWAEMTPQAKTILFGNAGKHIQDLNDMAAVARKMEQVQGKFGNPSGTGFITNFNRILGGLAITSVAGLKAAAGGAAVGGAGYGVAKFLARPAGASSAARYARALERAETNPGPQTSSALKLAERNLRNTAAAYAGHQPSDQKK